MIKYPLSKQPINADESFNQLKTVHNNMKKVLDNLNNAINVIKKNFHGAEFDAACEYIEKIKTNIINSNDNVINDILSKLTVLVNNYNSDIVDAEGLPYPVNRVSYKVNYLSDGRIVGTRGSLAGSDYIQVNLSDDSVGVNPTKDINGSEAKNDVVLDNDNSVNLDTGVTNSVSEKESEVVNQMTNSEVKNGVSDTPNKDASNTRYQNNYYNYVSSSSNDDVSNVIDYILMSGMDYNENTGFLYHNINYNWNSIVEEFLKKENLSNVVDSIVIKDKIITCNLLNGNSFVLNNVTSYNELKNSILMYLNELSSKM